MPKDPKTGLTLKKLMACKKEIDEANRKLPWVYIDGVKYIILEQRDKAE